MSGVAAYTVGFFLSRPHTHFTAADVIHAAVQMHITSSPSKHLHTYSYLRRRQHFSKNTDSHDKDKPDSEVMKNTEKISFFLCKQIFPFTRLFLFFFFPEK